MPRLVQFWRAKSGQECFSTISDGVQILNWHIPDKRLLEVLACVLDLANVTGCRLLDLKAG